jgi:hypothetical protein
MASMAKRQRVSFSRLSQERRHAVWRAVVKRGRAVDTAAVVGEGRAKRT